MGTSGGSKVPRRRLFPGVASATRCCACASRGAACVCPARAHTVRTPQPARRRRRRSGAHRLTTWPPQAPPPPPPPRRRRRTPPRPPARRRRPVSRRLCGPCSACAAASPRSPRALRGASCRTPRRTRCCASESRSWGGLAARSHLCQSPRTSFPSPGALRARRRCARDADTRAPTMRAATMRARRRCARDANECVRRRCARRRCARDDDACAMPMRATMMCTRQRMRHGLAHALF